MKLNFLDDVAAEIITLPKSLRLITAHQIVTMITSAILEHYTNNDALEWLDVIISSAMKERRSLESPERSPE